MQLSTQRGIRLCQGCIEIDGFTDVDLQIRSFLPGAFSGFPTASSTAAVVSSSRLSRSMSKSSSDGSLEAKLSRSSSSAPDSGVAIPVASVELSPRPTCSASRSNSSSTLADSLRWRERAQRRVHRGGRLADDILWELGVTHVGTGGETLEIKVTGQGAVLLFTHGHTRDHCLREQRIGRIHLLTKLHNLGPGNRVTLPTGRIEFLRPESRKT